MQSIMQDSKIFITGATGYIGGDVLKAMLDAYPFKASSITALVRNEQRGAALKIACPAITIVHGSLDDTSLIATEVAKVDIVLNLADADHCAATVAIIAGLQQRAAEGKQTYLIHNSGAGILMFKDVETNTFGETSEKIFDDWDNVNEITSVPDFAFHREVDKLVLAAGQDSLIKTAIVCPPTIYGVGRGTGNQRSAQIPMLAEAFLKRGEAFQVGEGRAVWTHVHVFDLSKLFAILIGEALAGGGKASWGSEGYYFAENGEHVSRRPIECATTNPGDLNLTSLMKVWGDICGRMADIAFNKGFIKTNEVAKLCPEDVEKIVSFGSRIWGQNSRCRAFRARNLFHWTSSEKTLVDELPTAVDYEARRLRRLL